MMKRLRTRILNRADKEKLLKVMSLKKILKTPEKKKTAEKI